MSANQFDGKQLACNSMHFVSIYLVAIPKCVFSIQAQDSAIPRQTALASAGEFKGFGQAPGIGKPGGEVADMSAHALRSGDSIGSRSRCRRTGCPRLGVLLGFQISRISICSAMGHRSSIGASKAGSFGRRALNRWPPSIPILMQASPIVSANGVFDFPLSSPHYFIILNRDSCVLNRRNVRGLGVRFQFRPSGN